MPARPGGAPAPQNGRHSVANSCASTATNPRRTQGGETERCEDDGGRRKRVNGSLVQVTAVFGFALAGLVVNGIAGRGSV
ncbi:MAG: hypothetical protein AB2L13_13000 [Spirochaetota bacterium]